MFVSCEMFINEANYQLNSIVAGFKHKLLCYLFEVHSIEISDFYASIGGLHRATRIIRTMIRCEWIQIMPESDYVSLH